MLLLLFIAAFATDLGAWYRQGSEQQRAADVGSLNGISAYDREAKLLFPSGNGWDDLPAVATATTPSIGQVEQVAFDAAVDQIQNLLETSGLTFPATRPAANYAIDPNPTNIDPTNPAQASTITLVADDGTRVTITRTWAQAGFALDGVTPVFSRVIDISITNEGDQFFSNVLRSAPEITRSAQGLLANCGAVCNDVIEINPPFVGFRGSGNGDGFGPLLFDRTGDGVPDETWAVNHHSNGTNTGQIICVELETELPCPGHNAPNQAFALDYQTGNRPVEYIHPDGRIYFAARQRSTQALGLACWDAAAKDYCANEFISFWTQTTGTNFPAWINATGPFQHNGRLYIVSQDGQIGCATLALAPCSSAFGTAANPQAIDIAGSDTSNLPALNNGNFVSNGEQSGSTLILTQNGVAAGGSHGVLFRCLNLTNEVPTHCGNHWEGGFGVGGDDNLTFTRYNSAGASQGVCVFHIQNGNSECVNWTATPQGALPGIASGLDRLQQGWGGDTFTWTDSDDPSHVRTFFAGGNSNRVGCWNWQTQSACTDGPDDGGAYLITDNDRTGFGAALPYAFDQISERCLLGLGHQAVFFSFDPVGFGPCTDVEITTPITPCECDDANAGERWGLINLPEELLNQVTRLEATVSTGEDFRATTIPGFDQLDVLNGQLDLTPLNTDPGGPYTMVYLTLQADSALSGDDPVFTEPTNFNLEITTPPTLSE